MASRERRLAAARSRATLLLELFCFQPVGFALLVELLGAPVVRFPPWRFPAFVLLAVLVALSVRATLDATIFFATVLGSSFGALLFDAAFLGRTSSNFWNNDDRSACDRGRE